MFPYETIQKIYDKNRIKKCLLLQNLTDTDITSLTFIFICYKDCIVKESEACNLIFKIMINSKIFERLDLADEFYKHFGGRNKKLKKQVGLYEVESIDNPTMVIIAINPKEYFEQYKFFSINKRAKGIRKDTQGMNFDGYANRLSPKDEQLCNKNILQKRFQIKHNSIQMVSVKKKGLQVFMINDFILWVVSFLYLFDINI